MPTSTDLSLNDRIALAKGWRHTEKPLKALWFGYLGRKSPKFTPLTYWLNPKGKPAIRPDYVGTLEGVSGLLLELNKPCSIWAKTRRWLWYWDRLAKKFVCQEELYVWGASPAFRIQKGCQFWSPDNRPGDCVGNAWLSVFEKEATDASTD